MRISPVKGIQPNFSFIWNPSHPDTEKGELQPLSPKLILLWLTIFCSDCQIDLSVFKLGIFNEISKVNFVG